MDIKTVRKLANLLGIKNYIEGGRLKLEAQSAGDNVKVWAAAGYDVRKERSATTTTWGVYDQRGVYIACVLACDDMPGYSYSYTALP